MDTDRFPVDSQGAAKMAKSEGAPLVRFWLGN
jgi:hypothetical protein